MLFQNKRLLFVSIGAFLLLLFFVFAAIFDIGKPNYSVQNKNKPNVVADNEEENPFFGKDPFAKKETKTVSFFGTTYEKPVSFSNAVVPGSFPTLLGYSDSLYLVKAGPSNLLYLYDSTTHEKTKIAESVKNAFFSSDGTKVIFYNDYAVFSYDVASMTLDPSSSNTSSTTHEITSAVEENGVVYYTFENTSVLNSPISSATFTLNHKSDFYNLNDRQFALSDTSKLWSSSHGAIFRYEERSNRLLLSNVTSDRFVKNLTDKEIALPVTNLPLKTFSANKDGTYAAVYFVEDKKNPELNQSILYVNGKKVNTFKYVKSIEWLNESLLIVHEQSGLYVYDSVSEKVKTVSIDTNQFTLDQDGNLLILNSSEKVLFYKHKK